MTEEETIDERRERRIRMGQTVRVLVVLVVIGLLALFAALNTADVEIDYLFGDVTAPMIIVIAVSAVAGLIIGLVATGRGD